MFAAPTTTINRKYKFCWLFWLAILSICCQCCYGKMAYINRYNETQNPNIYCPAKNEENIWHPCEYGGYIAENPNPRYCNDRYVCYKGLNEQCSRDDKCADNAICTMCGICQKCDSAENCSEFQLCPNINGFQAMNYIKRFLQKRSTKITSH